MPSVCPINTPEGRLEVPNDRRSLCYKIIEILCMQIAARLTHQTFKNVSSEALIKTLPDAVSAQQQLFTSSACALILTVRRSASRS